MIFSGSSVVKGDKHTPSIMATFTFHTQIIGITLFIMWASMQTDGMTTETPGGDTPGASDGAGTDVMLDDTWVAGGNETMNDTKTEGNTTAPDSEDMGTDANEVEGDKNSQINADNDVSTGPRADGDATIPGSHPSVPSVHFVSTGPLCMTNADCNVTNSERCTEVREEVHRCECLAGHTRGSDGLTCVASTVYYVELGTEQPLTEDMKDHSSSPFRKFKYEAKDGAIRALQSSKLSAIVIDVAVSQLSSSTSGHVTVRYDVSLLRSYVPDSVVVATDIREAFRNKLVVQDDGTTILGDTSIPISSAQVQTMEVRDANPCAHPLLHYCAPSALCVLSARSFTCRCRRGYLDTSPDVLHAPGEHCTLSCGCKNGGECQLDDQGTQKCSCQRWYLGARCGVDARLLLIVLAVVLVVLLLLAVICCACCLRYWRRRYRDHGPLPKLPPGGRSSYDTWRYYSFASPTYVNATTGGKWSTVSHRPQHPPFMAYRRPASELSHPIELVPPGYGTYGPIPRPHVLPSASMPRQNRPSGAESQWVWSTTDQESSFA